MNDWHYENLRSGISTGLYGKTLYETNRVKVIQSEGFGRVLYIDGSLQSCEFDEYIYHEMMVHPAMQLHTDPKKVLIIGGGDGGTLREVLKYDTVETVDMVEINEVVVETAKEYLPHMKLKESLQDERVKLFIGCGYKFLKNPEHSGYDVILVDIGDPTDESIVFYSQDFIDLAHFKMSQHGVITLQSQYFLAAPDFVRGFKTLCSAKFWSTNYCHCPIPTYPFGGIGFMRSCKTPNVRVSLKFPKGLKYLNISTMNASHILPVFITENRFDKFLEETVIQIFNWKKYVLGVDLDLLSSFVRGLDGESPFSPNAFPSKSFTMGMKDGRPYYKLRLCTDVAKEKIGNAIKKSLHARTRALPNVEGLTPCGVEWDSFDNRHLSVIYKADQVDSFRQNAPEAFIYFPDQYYDKSFIVLQSDLTYDIEVFSPKVLTRINHEGVINTHRPISRELLAKRLFRGTLREVDYLLDNGLKLYSMAFDDIVNYELTLEI